MNNILGFMRVRVKRGINLAVRDARTSDPYVVITMGQDQEVKTKTINSNCNPQWNEELTLLIKNINEPIRLVVYDHDLLSQDDAMGHANIDIKPYLRCLRIEGLKSLSSPSTISTVPPNEANCLAEESFILWNRGKILQDMKLKLRNVECGQVEIQIEWCDVPGNKGLPLELDI